MAQLAKLSVTLLYTLLIGAIGAPLEVGGSKTNHNYKWKCVTVDSSLTTKDCTIPDISWSNKHSTHNSYGDIHVALRLWQRNVYTPLDSDWVSELSKPGSLLRVHHVGMEQLRTVEMPPPTVLPSRPHLEEYQIVYVKLLDHELENFRYRDVDEFLKNNPCWVPMHEPRLEEEDFVQAKTNKGIINLMEVSKRSMQQRNTKLSLSTSDANVETMEEDNLTETVQDELRRRSLVVGHSKDPSVDSFLEKGKAESTVQATFL